MLTTSHHRAAGFRADIECLRGVAVLSVVLFHAWPGLLPGGYVGVDIFFVISGFLITGILLRDLNATGRIDLLEFWARRTRRILPAACLVLVATSAVAALTISPVDFRDLYRDVGAAALYVLNWRLAARSVDYLAEGEPPSLVLHYWSLSIEEQFYILFPLLLLSAAWIGRRVSQSRPDQRWPVLTIALLWLASFAWCLYLTAADQPLAFFHTGARAWQLMTGGLVAASCELAAAKNESLRRLIALVGMALITAALAMLSADTIYPGWVALVPTLGAAAIIFAAREPHLERSALATAPLQALAFAGRYSYAWYLWHWPVLTLGAIWLPVERPAQRMALIAISFALAVITQELIENPIRFRPALVRSRLLSLGIGTLMSSTALVAAAGVAWLGTNAQIELPDGRRLSLDELKDDNPRSYRDGCHLSFKGTAHAPCAYGKVDGTRAIVLLGDSHAAQFLPGLDKAAADAGLRLLSRTKSTCPPFDIGVRDIKRRRVYDDCHAWRAAVWKEIEDLKPSAVFLASYYDYYLTADVMELPGTPDEIATRFQHAIGVTVGKLTEAADRVYVLKDTPHFASTPIRCLGHGGASLTLPGCHWPLDRQSGSFAPVLPPGSKGEVIDLNGAICPNGLCRVVANGSIVMRDTHHLTASFAATLAPVFGPLLPRDH